MPLGAGDHRSPLRIITTTTEFFGGKAPTAARRASLVQRSDYQGLQGNPDACCPRRGVVGPSYGSFASGQARKLTPSAGPPLPTEPASLGFGGGPNYRKRQPMGRAAMHARSLPCPYNPPPPTAPVLGGAGGTPPAPSFPPFLREEMGAPAGQAPAGRPSLHRAGGYYPPLQGTAVATRRVGVFHGGAPSEWSEDGRARRVVAPHEVSGCGGKRADTRRECSGVDH